MKVIYVAGPYRGPNAWAIEQNIRSAEELALEVWRLGAVALSPHLNTAHFQGVLSDETWLKGDLELLSRCDAMILTTGWRDSAGTLAEVQHAVAADKPVFQTLDELAAWLDRPVPATLVAPGIWKMSPADPAPHRIIFRAL